MFPLFLLLAHWKPFLRKWKANQCPQRRWHLLSPVGQNHRISQAPWVEAALTFSCGKQPLPMSWLGIKLKIHSSFLVIWHIPRVDVALSTEFGFETWAFQLKTEKAWWNRVRCRDGKWMTSLGYTKIKMPMSAGEHASKSGINIRHWLKGSERRWSADTANNKPVSWIPLALQLHSVFSQMLCYYHEWQN